MGLVRTLCTVVLKTLQLQTPTATALLLQMRPALPGQMPTWQPCWRRWTLKAKGNHQSSLPLDAAGLQECAMTSIPHN